MLCAATSARADPAATSPSWIVGGGIGGEGIRPSAAYNPSGEDSGFIPLAFLLGAVHGEIAYRPPRWPIYAHAMVSSGTNGSDDARWSARLGGEYRPCTTRGGACFVADADVGYLHVAGICQNSPGDMQGCTSDAGTRAGVALGGRLGFDVGWTHVRIRTTLDYTRAFPMDRFAVDQYGAHRDLGGFLMLDVGVAAAF